MKVPGNVYLPLMRRIRCRCAEEKGQMITELLLTTPLFLLALVMVVNVSMFVAEAARFDRVVNEVARALIASEADPALSAAVLLNEGLGYAGGMRGPFRAHVNVEARNELFLERRILHFRLEYRLFAAKTAQGSGGIGVFRRNKILAIFWSRGL